MKPVKTQADAKAEAEAQAQAAKLRQLGITLDNANWTEITIRSLGSLVIIRATDPQGVSRSGAREDGDALVSDLLGLGVAPPPRVSKVEETAPAPEPVDAELSAISDLAFDTTTLVQGTVAPLSHPDEEDERDDLINKLREDLEASESRAADLSRQLEQARAEGPVPLPPNPAETKLSDYGEVGEEADLKPDHLLDFMRNDQSEDLADTGDIIAKLSSAKRKRFTELLNVELAELQQMRGAAGENLTRETEIEKLLGLFARVGEM